MERFDIANLAHKKPSQLSGGQQQRVAIARALIQDPPIILADEPVGNLDSVNAQTVLDLLEELNEKDKKTIIHVTHNPNDLEKANTVFYMKDGKITKETTNQKKKRAPLKLSLPASDLEYLTKLYPHLGEEELRIKLIVNHLLNSFGLDTQRRLEYVVKQYIKKEIDETTLFSLLDKPIEEEGVGLYLQKAKEFSKKIIEFTNESALMAQEIEYAQQPNKTVELRKYLLDNIKLKISSQQLSRLDEYLAERINNNISKKTLEKLFDQSYEKGGVGLDRRTAKKIANEAEAILLDKALSQLL
jgi:putative ABC transport system ATP-binding protein